MGKGVKKIQYAGGKIYKSRSVPDKSLLVPAEEYISFKVKEWEADTKEEDKKKGLMWIWQSNDNPKFIIGQMQVSTSKLFRFMIPKKLCGPYTYYIEASLSGKRSIKNTGIYVTGYSQPLITKSKWCVSNDGVDVRKNKKFSYGEVIYLNLDTEGLNGFRGLVVEVYNRQTLKSDKKIFTYTNVKVSDGEVNLELPNTNLWQGLIDNIREEEEFYIKIKDGVGKYIPDSDGDVAHARYLRIKNQLIKNQPKKPANLTPVKVGQTEVKKKRDELCKFDEITITETQKKDGKIEQNKVSVFKEGQSLVGVKNPQEIINKTIFFEFDQAVLTPKSIEALDNVLNFLLGNPYTTITIDGFACVIGKAEYNRELSLKRSEAVKKHFVNGGLNPKLIRCNAKGEIQLNNGKHVGGENDDKKGKDNLVYKDEKNYLEARRVDISFLYTGHDAKTIVYETIAPSHDKDILIDVLSFDSKACFSEKKHKKQIKVTSAEYKEKNGKIKEGDSMQVPVHSALAWWNVAPMQYIWPKWNLVKGMTGNGIDAAVLYNLHVHSCRYFSNNENAAVLIKVYPDIVWTAEFKWNHKEAFAYSYGKKLHPYDLKTGAKKALGSAMDGAWSKEYGEMSQSFEFSLQAEWNNKTQKLELGKEWGEKIAKTLKKFNQLKQLSQKIINSPVTNGKVTIEIKAPVVAGSLQWGLKKASNGTMLCTSLEFAIETKPLIEVESKIDLWKIFRRYGPNAIIPGAGEVINFILEKLEGNVGIHFIVVFTGSINFKGKIEGDTESIKNTIGKVSVEGKIQVTLEFKAWANGDYGVAGFEGYIKADVSTSITGAFDSEISKTGLSLSPKASFDGVIAKYVAVGTIKFGFFKRTFQKDGKFIIVEPMPAKFDPYYLIGPYK